MTPERMDDAKLPATCERCSDLARLYSELAAALERAADTARAVEKAETVEKWKYRWSREITALELAIRQAEFRAQEERK